MIKTFSEIKALYDKEGHKVWYFLLFLSLVSGLLRSLFLALTNKSIELYGEQQSYHYYFLLLTLLMLTALSANYVLMVKNRKISTQLLIRIRHKLLAETAQANLQLVEQSGISNLHYHIMHSTWVISTSFGALLAFVTAGITLLFNFIYIGWLSFNGLLLAIMLTIVGIMIHFKQEKKNLPNRKEIDRTSNRITQLHYAFLHGYKEVRLCEEKTGNFFGKIQHTSQQNYQAVKQESHYSAFAELSASLFQYVIILVIVFALPLLVSIDATTLLQLLTAILFTVAPLEAMVASFPAFSDAGIALGHYKKIRQDIKKTLENQCPQTEKLLPAFETITLKDIVFRYDNSDNFCLGPINLSLNKGEIIFITGGNGAGKSVLLKVLTGLYHQQQGHFIYNGRKLGENQRQVYREQFTAVFNDFYLFDELLFNHNYTDAQINQLIKHFDLEGKTEFKAGKFSNIELSTGQRKRLALITAIIEDKPIMVLDEFAAEQDPLHRDAFYYQWLPELKQQGKTLVVVSHDQQYFHCADRIIQMDLGKIASS